MSDPFDELEAKTLGQKVLVDACRMLWDFSRHAIIELGQEGKELPPAMLVLSKYPPSDDEMTEKFIRHDIAGGGATFLVPLAGLFIDELDEVRPIIMALLLKRLNAVAYVVMSEAWTLPPGTEMPEHPIHEDDRRISVVQITGQNKEGDTVHAAFRINEGKKKRTISREPQNMILATRKNGLEFGGRLSNLLD